MSLKNNFKEMGKNIGKAFKNFGVAVGTTAKVAFTDETNSNGEGKKTKTGEAWSNVGKSFSKAGKSVGKAFSNQDISSLDEEEKASPKDTGQEVQKVEPKQIEQKKKE